MSDPARLLDRYQIADLLAVKPGTVSQWDKRGLLPPPAVVWRMGRVWNRRTILEWAADTGRLPPGAYVFGGEHAARMSRDHTEKS